MLKSRKRSMNYLTGVIDIAFSRTGMNNAAGLGQEYFLYLPVRIVSHPRHRYMMYPSSVSLHTARKTLYISPCSIHPASYLSSISPALMRRTRPPFGHECTTPQPPVHPNTNPLNPSPRTPPPPSHISVSGL